MEFSQSVTSPSSSPIAIGTSSAESPRTDPGGRGSHTGFLTHVKGTGSPGLNPNFETLSNSTLCKGKELQDGKETGRKIPAGVPSDGSGSESSGLSRCRTASSSRYFAWSPTNGEIEAFEHRAILPLYFTSLHEEARPFHEDPTMPVHSDHGIRFSRKYALSGS